LKNKRARGEIFNIGTGQPIKIKKIINSIQYTIKKGKPNYGKIKLRKDEILNLYPKINKAKNIINWRPRIKFQNGLKKTINYYKSLK
jgi:nucleoside-diphosphate-sugar epimerase